jgi:hypothetical protein
MKIDEFKDSIYYRIACGCGSNDHDTTIEFEYDKDLPGMVFINFHKKLVWSSHYGTGNFITRFWKRITGALKILFLGYIEVEESLILRDKEHIDGFIEALEEGKRYIMESDRLDEELVSKTSRR